jgi:hypothetical protein
VHRGRVNWIRNILADVSKAQRTTVAATIRQTILQPYAELAHQT